MNIKIYKLYCQNAPKYYIGSTCNIDNRIKQHKYNASNPSSKYYNLPMYQYIRSNGGFDIWTYEILFTCECDSYQHRLRIERQFFIEHKNNLLNCNYPMVLDGEYYARIRDKRLAEIKIKYDCTCDSTYTIDHRSRHMKTLKHKQGELYNITNNFDIQNDFNLYV
jgi:hypothetical protein